MESWCRCSCLSVMSSPPKCLWIGRQTKVNALVGKNEQNQKIIGFFILIIFSFFIISFFFTNYLLYYRQHVHWTTLRPNRDECLFSVVHKLKWKFRFRLEVIFSAFRKYSFFYAATRIKHFFYFSSIWKSKSKRKDSFFNILKKSKQDEIIFILFRDARHFLQIWFRNNFVPVTKNTILTCDTSSMMIYNVIAYSR